MEPSTSSYYRLVFQGDFAHSELLARYVRVDGRRVTYFWTYTRGGCSHADTYLIPPHHLEDLINSWGRYCTVSPISEAQFNFFWNLNKGVGYESI